MKHQPTPLLHNIPSHREADYRADKCENAAEMTVVRNGGGGEVQTDDGRKAGRRRLGRCCCSCPRLSPASSREGSRSWKRAVGSVRDNSREGW